MLYLKADTNTEVLIGPVVAVGDGFTPVTTLSLSTADEAEIIKYGGATPLTVTSISANGFAAITSADGYYTLDISTSNSDTEGFLTVLINDDSLCLPIRVDFMVVNANVYDSLFAAATTDYLQTDVAQWLGTAAATPTTAGVPEVDVTFVSGTAQTANDNGADINTLLTRIVGTLAAGTHNPATAAQIAVLSDWINGGRLDLLLDAIKLVTDTQTAIAPATLVDLIWDESLAAHQTALTAGRATSLGGVPIAETTATGTPTTTVIQLTAGSATDDFYIDQPLKILSGTGAGQVRIITSYTGATKTCNFDEGFTVAPAASDAVAVGIQHIHSVSQIADGVWDEVLTGATHNITNSAGKALRQIDAAFTVHSGTAQAGAAGTITLDTGASATDNIYRGDRCVIVGGTGVGEHGIITAYNGTTKVATMSETWVITPDATSEFELVPADADIETWQHTVVSNGATSGFPVVDAQAISDSTGSADAITEARLAELDAGNIPADIDELTTQGDTNETKLDTIDTVVDAVLVDTAAILIDSDELQTDWTDGGRLDLLLDRLITELDTARGEPAQGTPAASTKIGDKIDYLYKAWRNKTEQTATTLSIYDDAGTTVDHKSTVSDDLTTATKGEIVTGP